jgi:hypothetical protein
VVSVTSAEVAWTCFETHQAGLILLWLISSENHLGKKTSYLT